MQIKDIHQSKTVRGVVLGLGIAAILLGVFELGTVAGYHKAKFSGRFGDNFQRNFMDPRGGFFRDELDARSSVGGHGVVGRVVSIALPLVIVAGPDNLEKTVVIGGETLIRRFRDNVTSTDIKVGDFVVVLGNPNDDGQVEAKLVRIAPPPDLETNPK